MKNLYIVLLAGFLVACSSGNDFEITNPFRTWDTQFTDVNDLTAQLRSDKIKPVPLNDLPFQIASLESSNRINITANSPIVNFPEGNSFVSALLIPDNVNKFTFILESHIGRTVFVPHVIFLNENLQEVSRVDDFEYKPAGFLLMQKEFKAELTPDIRYILIYSQDSDLEGRTEIVDVAREYELKKGKELPDSSYPKLYAKHSPIGNISVYFKDVFFSAQSIKQGLAAEDTTAFKSAPLVKAPAILNDTEAFYLEQISKAIKENNPSRALSLVEEAERAGSTKVRSHYEDKLENQ